MPIHGAGNSPRPDENFSASFLFEDGSSASLVYTSLGNPALPKERFEAHWNGKSAVLDDFRALSFPGTTGLDRSGAQDKGHAAALTAFLDAIRDGQSFPIPWEELASTTRLAIELDREVWGHLTDTCAES
jgi:hypothetical protein